MFPQAHQLPRHRTAQLYSQLYRPPTGQLTCRHVPPLRTQHSRQAIHPLALLQRTRVERLHSCRPTHPPTPPRRTQHSLQAMHPLTLRQHTRVERLHSCRPTHPPTPRRHTRLDRQAIHPLTLLQRTRVERLHSCRPTHQPTPLRHTQLEHQRDYLPMLPPSLLRHTRHMRQRDCRQMHPRHTRLKHLPITRHGNQHTSRQEPQQQRLLPSPRSHRRRIQVSHLRTRPLSGYPPTQHNLRRHCLPRHRPSR
jgi:hypothetical protein